MSPVVANVLIALVALVQVAIALVEMFFWRRPRVHGRLDFNAAEASKVAPIVANAGLYNSFLAAGLIWALLAARDGTAVAVFFLVCVVIAGVFGAATLKPTTLVLQTTPAAAALAAVWMARF
jgi:putative membrane protein